MGVADKQKSKDLKVIAVKFFKWTQKKTWDKRTKKAGVGWNRHKSAGNFSNYTGWLNLIMCIELDLLNKHLTVAWLETYMIEPQNDLGCWRI